MDKQIEHRFARLTWNTNGWIKPSGREAKSGSKATHENSKGFGHEEWLFDTRQIDDYCYGFLEPIHKEHGAYVGKNFRVWLYTIDAGTKQRFWVGEIKKITVISTDKENEIKDVYRQRGWLDQMRMDLVECGLDPNLLNLNFNIKFETKDIELQTPLFQIPTDHSITSVSRYVFGNFKPEYGLWNNIEVDDEEARTFPEGREIYRLHRSKERNRALVEEAKRIYIEEHTNLPCQVCDFSFLEAYGELGEGFIEAHHIVPMAELRAVIEARIEHLIMVCSNCHRMLHCRRPELSIDELKSLLKSK